MPTQALLSRLLLLGIATRVTVVLLGILLPQQRAAENSFTHPQLYAQLHSGWHQWIEPW